MQTRSRAPTKKSILLEEDELVVHLSDSVRRMYAGWNMKWEFHVNRESKPRVMIGQATTITPHSGVMKWKTITVGRWTEVKKLLEGPGADVAMSKIGKTMFETSKRSSIDITHFVFCSKRTGRIKHMYVESHILTKFEYFQRCHSTDYSETQHANESLLKTKGKGRLVEDSETEELDESQFKMNQMGYPEGIYDDDSDDGWDSDSDESEADKVPMITSFKMISSKQLFMSPTPLEEHIEHLLIMPDASQTERLTQGRRTPWPEWAEAHCIPHTVVPGFKILSSPKSLYRLADMLIIPELKTLCHKQIVECLDVRYVISELNSSVFQQHEELRVEAYKFMRKNWKLYNSKDIASFIKDLSQEEAELVSDHILKNLSP
ncbi:hypothetical protein DFH28DRAFT_1077780 [Melampsora americana]|nr:hypothetical protein DFH28DRAFT_1077780 [Melampsora americana]